MFKLKDPTGHEDGPMQRAAFFQYVLPERVRDKGFLHELSSSLPE
jgi:hypothetical protein